MKDTSIFSREEWAIIGDSLDYYRERIESLLWLNERLDGGVTALEPLKAFYRRRFSAVLGPTF